MGKVVRQLEPEQMPQVYDVHGLPRDWEWVREQFGEVTYLRTDETGPDGLVFRLAVVRETVGPASVVMRVYDARGPELEPMQGSVTGLFWPDPEKPISTEGALSRWAEYVGATMQTNQDGHAGYGLGGGSYYYPPEVGPHWAWILSPSARSDALTQFGMLSGTNHHGILSMTFYLYREEEPTPPQPPTGKRLFVLQVDDSLKVEAVGYRATLQALELETDLSDLGLSLEPDLSDARYPVIEKKLGPVDTEEVKPCQS